MSFFHHEEPPNPSKRCKFLASVLKDAFASFRTRISTSNPQEEEEEEPDGDYNDEEEVFVSAIISKYMESKCKRKSSIAIDSFNWAFSPAAGDLFITSKSVKETSNEEDRDDFFSVGSHLSRCSSATSFDAFVSVKTCFSRCSSLSWIDSLSRIDFKDFRRRSIIQELCHFEGWPFGLCRKALLLPPLPKSPSDSWSWRKSTRMVKIH
ncbi:hypothetical protein Fot_56271 [Forsythia ovata]|uniref:Uncharacterized protein n=1 Tax=Forsythia ovata TaxID=205694 RepID=A0ABD1P0S7_9LAMI